MTGSNNTDNMNNTSTLINLEYNVACITLANINFMTGSLGQKQTLKLF